MTNVRTRLKGTRSARWSGRLNVRATLLPLLATLTLGWAGAQQQLMLNGMPVAGLSTELVPGTAYIPAEPYARALGADYRFDPTAGVLLSFGGRLATLRSFDTAARAAAATDALTVDGRTPPSMGAVREGGTVYLPVKSVTAAFGGRTAYLSEQRTVAVVFPRPQLMAVDPPEVWGSSERFVLSFSAPVNREHFFDASLNVLRFRFPRAELGSDALAERRLPTGSRYSDAALVPEVGFLDFNLILQEGNTYSAFSEPFGGGERVVIDIFRAAEGRADAQSPALLLKAGTGTAAFAEQVQSALEARGTQVRSAAGGAGGGAPFMLALRRAPLAAGRFNIYYLTGDAPLLDAPVRFAAADAASEEGRARVAHLTPDLARGERLARALADALERRTPLTLGALLGAPLLDLSGAAGRGVMLELSAADLEGSALVEPVADALNTLARSP